jgi:hypothetical protein
MANITLHNLADEIVSGVSLFDDSESFMLEITDGEVIIGGVNACTPITDILQGTTKIDTCLTICPPQPPIA